MKTYEAEFVRNGITHTIAADDLTEFMQYIKDNGLLADFDKYYFIDDEHHGIRAYSSFPPDHLALEIAKKLNRAMITMGYVPYANPVRTEEIIKLFTQIKFLLKKHDPGGDKDAFDDYITSIEHMLMEVERRIITNKKEVGEPMTFQQHENARYEQQRDAMNRKLSEAYPRKFQMTAQYRQKYHEPEEGSWDLYDGSYRQGE